MLVNVVWPGKSREYLRQRDILKRWKLVANELNAPDSKRWVIDAINTLVAERILSPVADLRGERGPWYSRNPTAHFENYAWTYLAESRPGLIRDDRYIYSDISILRSLTVLGLSLESELTREDLNLKRLGRRLREWRDRESKLLTENDLDLNLLKLIAKNKLDEAYELLAQLSKKPLILYMVPGPASRGRGGENLWLAERDRIAGRLPRSRRRRRKSLRKRYLSEERPRFPPGTVVEGDETIDIGEAGPHQGHVLSRRLLDTSTVTCRDCKSKLSSEEARIAWPPAEERLSRSLR